MSATNALAAPRCMTACQPYVAASGPKQRSPSARPSGQLDTRVAIAVVISRPANQSAIILVTSTLNSTEPVPESSRPAAADANDELTPIIAPPATIRARPASTIRFAPKRWPSIPPGSAMKIPGSI